MLFATVIPTCDLAIRNQINIKKTTCVHCTHVAVHVELRGVYYSVVYIIPYNNYDIMADMAWMHGQMIQEGTKKNQRDKNNTSRQFLNDAKSTARQTRCPRQ